jgi:3-mercaptopyruvate sulfurtransferase SseA
MATKNRQQPSSSPNMAYAVLTAGAIAVLALVGWALYRSFNAPVSSTIVTAPSNATAPIAAQPVSSSDDEAAKAAVPRISAEDLHQKIARNEITLIDVRTKEGWDSGHIRGAMHIPLASVESYLSYIPHDKPIVTYCT